MHHGIYEIPPFVEAFPVWTIVAIVSAVPAQANNIIDYCIFRWSFSVDKGPISPQNNFVFVPNWLLNLTTWNDLYIFPTKISPIEEGVGHATSSGWVVCHFVLLQRRKPIIFHNWVPQAAQLFNPAPSQIVLTQMTAQMQGRIWGEGAGGVHPPPPPRWPAVF